MTFEEWVAQAPAVITEDSLWRVEAYRLSLFAADVCWHDLSKLRRTRDVMGQLNRAVGSMSANIAEGYSRGSQKDRARFYEYSLGSARESRDRDWYFKVRHVLGPQVTDHRLALITQAIRLLLTMVPDQRGYAVHDAEESYGEAGQ